MNKKERKQREKRFDSYFLAVYLANECRQRDPKKLNSPTTAFPLPRKKKAVLNEPPPVNPKFQSFFLATHW